MAHALFRNSRGQDSRERRCRAYRVGIRKKGSCFVAAFFYIIFHSSCTAASVWSRNVGLEKAVYGSTAADVSPVVVVYRSYTHFARTHVFLLEAVL